VTKGNQTKALLNKIPGVSSDTKASLDNVLAQAKSFASGAIGSTPNTIAAKKDEVDGKIRDIIKKAQGEAKKAKATSISEEAAAVKEKVENQTFSIKRFASRTWEKFKLYFLFIVIAILALWGGSMTSNAMFDLPLYMRVYYFIYGTLLFPIAFIFAILRYTNNRGGQYHAIIAPFVEGPILNPVMAGILYPFTYVPKSTMVVPLPVSAVIGPAALPEAAILAKAQQNALARTGLIGTGI